MSCSCLNRYEPPRIYCDHSSPISIAITAVWFVCVIGLCIALGIVNYEMPALDWQKKRTINIALGTTLGAIFALFVAYHLRARMIEYDEEAKIESAAATQQAVDAEAAADGVIPGPEMEVVGEDGISDDDSGNVRDK